jgi:hypothetical protein
LFQIIIYKKKEEMDLTATAFAATMKAGHVLFLVQLFLGHPADTNCPKIRVPRLNTPQTTQILISRLQYPNKLIYLIQKEMKRNE